MVSLLTQEWVKSHQVVLAVFDASGLAYPYGGTLVDLSLAAEGGAWKKARNALARVMKLVRVIRHERPTRIISFMESANFPAVVSACLSGCLRRLTVSVRNDPDRFPMFYRGLIPLLYRMPSRVVAVSTGVQAALAHMGVPAAKLQAIPNPVVVRIDSHAAVPVLQQRFVLAVGRLHSQKGFDQLLQAFSSLGRPEINLVILGDGAEKARLLQLARDLELEKRVHLIGSVPDPALWYRRASCFVLSSRYEGWPNVLMEAMACGCAVVSFDCNYGPSEIIEHEVNGLLVKEGDIVGLVSAIRQVLDGESLRRQLSINGQKRAAEFTVERIAECWLEK